MPRDLNNVLNSLTTATAASTTGTALNIPGGSPHRGLNVVWNYRFSGDGGTSPNLATAQMVVNASADGTTYYQVGAFRNVTGTTATPGGTAAAASINSEQTITVNMVPAVPSVVGPTYVYLQTVLSLGGSAPSCVFDCVLCASVPA